MSSIYVEMLDSKRAFNGSLYGKYFRQSTGIAASFPISKDMPSFVFIKATTARTVLLPAEEDVDGKVHFIHNEGTGTITLNTSSGGALSPAVTIASGAAAVIMSVAAVWKKIADR